MKYGIIVDSGCDLKELKSDVEIQYVRVPLTLRVGEKEFVDNNLLDIESFMREMESYSGATSSAAPAPMEWYDAYMQAEEVFAITLTGALSGSYNSAIVARDMVLEEHPSKKICVLDSKSAGSGLALLALKLQELIEQGLAFEQIEEEIKKYQKNMQLFFILESFANLIKNGRISKLAGSVAGILGIKVLCGASEKGTIEILKKCRGKLTVYEKMIQEMENQGFHGGRVIISHCFQEKIVKIVTDMIREKFPQCEIVIMPTGGLCSYYAERGGMILTFES